MKSVVDPSKIDLLMKSGRFDADWYVRRYPDVALTGMDPAEHYLWLGERLGRRGNPSGVDDVIIDLHQIRPTRPKRTDDASAVLPDVDGMMRVLAKWEGLEKDYVCYQLGVERESDPLRVAQMYYAALKTRNILPNPLFDPEYYKMVNHLKFREDAVYHYLTGGSEKQLSTHRLFDHEWYLKSYPLARDVGDLIVHYWSNGYRNKILPVDEGKVPVLSPIKEAFFSEISIGKKIKYDSLIYREFNFDLNHLDDESLEDHYWSAGRSEGRLASIPALLDKYHLPGHCLPVDFDPKQYMSLHVDLEGAFLKNPWGALTHYISGGFSEGRLYNYAQVNGFVRPLSYSLSDDALASSKDKTPLCVLVHLYYPEMWGEIEPYIANIDFDFDLHVNLVESTWSSVAINNIRRAYPKAFLKISPNEGRDIGGFFSLLKNIDFSSYVAFALLHSKKSPHVTREYASLWKKNLFGAILGSRDLIRENIAAFLEDQEIGIIGSIRSRHAGIEGNEDGMKKLFEIYQISEEHQACEYVSGTMMMVRSEIMFGVYQPLSNHQFVSGDNKGIDHHIDGQVEHSVERIFGNVMKQLGYRFLWR